MVAWWLLCRAHGRRKFLHPACPLGRKVLLPERPLRRNMPWICTPWIAITMAPTAHRWCLLRLLLLRALHPLLFYWGHVLLDPVVFVALEAVFVLFRRCGQRAHWGQAACLPHRLLRLLFE